jgi:hypothetical protein
MARCSTSLRQLPIGFSPSQLLDRLLYFPPQLPQEPAHLPLGDADLLGSLLLRDQLLLGFLQGHQPVSLGLGHQQLSFAHPSGWTLSIGHFYFAQIGHYHFAATLAANAVVPQYRWWYIIHILSCWMTRRKHESIGYTGAKRRGGCTPRPLLSALISLRTGFTMPAGYPAR